MNNSITQDCESYFAIPMGFIAGITLCSLIKTIKSSGNKSASNPTILQAEDRLTKVFLTILAIIIPLIMTSSKPYELFLEFFGMLFTTLTVVQQYNKISSIYARTYRPC